MMRLMVVMLAVVSMFALAGEPKKESPLKAGEYRTDAGVVCPPPSFCTSGERLAPRERADWCARWVRDCRPLAVDGGVRSEPPLRPACYPMRDNGRGKPVIDTSTPLPCCWDPQRPTNSECSVHKPG